MIVINPSAPALAYLYPEHSLLLWAGSLRLLARSLGRVHTMMLAVVGRQMYWLVSWRRTGPNPFQLC